MPHGHRTVQCKWNLVTHQGHRNTHTNQGDRNCILMALMCVCSCGPWYVCVCRWGLLQLPITFITEEGVALLQGPLQLRSLAMHLTFELLSGQRSSMQQSKRGPGGKDEEAACKCRTYSSLCLNFVLNWLSLQPCTAMAVGCVSPCSTTRTRSSPRWSWYGLGAQQKSSLSKCK